MSFIGDMFGGGDDAGDAAIKASEISAGSQEEALAYLKEREAVPQQFREEALTNMAGIYGLPGGEGNQQQFIDQLIQSPLYQSIMSGQKSGEEAIMRNASQTGGLRSGNTNYNLYDYNTQLQNQALLETYNQNISALQGFAGLPSNSNNIANTMSNIGTTRGQGVIASAQAQQGGSQNSMNNMLGMGSLGVDMYSSGMMGSMGSGIISMLSKIGGIFSDRRLKKDIQKIGEVNGFNWYSFTWNKLGEALGLKGTTNGCMADEVFPKRPDAVTLKDGFMFINYSVLGV